MGKHMMATKAMHQVGDISRNKPDLAYIEQEADTYYIGFWEAGFGFRKVRFPKETTRELTDEEREKYGNSFIEQGCGITNRLVLEDGELEKVDE